MIRFTKTLPQRSRVGWIQPGFPSSMCRQPHPCNGGVGDAVASCVCCLGRDIAPAPRLITAYNAHTPRGYLARRAFCPKLGHQRCQNNYDTGTYLYQFLDVVVVEPIAGRIGLCALLGYCCLVAQASGGVRLCVPHGYGIAGNQIYAVTLQRRHTMDKESIGDGKIRCGQVIDQLVAKLLLESKIVCVR